MLVVVFNVILAYIIRIIVKKSVLSRAKLGKSVNRVVAITTGDRVDGLKEIEKWINEYPRALFGGRSSDMLFQDELNRLAL